MTTLFNEPTTGLAYRVRPAIGKRVARLFLLHGVGGNETNLIPLGSDIDKGVEIVFVRGPNTLGPEQYAWFQVRFGANGPVINEPQADESRLRLRAFVQSLAQQDGAERLPTIMAGFSQGGILSASVALTAPGDVPHFAILSGRILPELAPHLAPAEKLAQLSAFIAHGRYDDKLTVEFAKHADAWLTKLGVPHELRFYDVSHMLNAEIVKDFSHWVSQQINVA